MIANQTILKMAVFSPLMQTFDYLLSDNISKNALQPGMRIKIPFGRQKKVGVFLEFAKTSQIPISKLKPILKVLDSEPIFSPEIFDLCKWTADYYQYPIGEVFATALPKLLREGEASFDQHAVFELTKKGIDFLEENIKKKTQQMKLLCLLKNKSLQMKEIFEEGFKERSVKRLLKFELTKTIPFKATGSGCLGKSFSVCLPTFKLNGDQEKAVQEIIKANNFQAFLLAGVTGSGKTEVYFRAIEFALKSKKHVLFLVPEISLTPQTIERFKNRFNVPMAVLHSGLTDQERFKAWQQAKSGDAAIVIGTRSAIFTPIQNLGLIVIDEEHDLSFKQQSGLQYSARDLAIVRAQLEKIPVILGSATPSLESLQNIFQGRYQRLDLKKRVGDAKFPTIKLLDLRNKKLEAGLSKELLQAIKEHLDNKKQVMLFLNRRGFSPRLMCRHCGWIPVCEHCDFPFVLHRQPKKLFCHHCGLIKTVITHCSRCQSSELWEIGYGTEKLESTLQKYFPDKTILRIDRDSTRKKGSFDEMFAKVHSGEANILVGTQMLAKGHHFPALTLVAIVDADHGLYSPDFRALERLGQLLIQVAGRAGREMHEGEVYIQTFYPEHPQLRALLEKGYDAFAQTLLEERKKTSLPPFQHLVLLRAESKKPMIALEFLRKVSKQFNQNHCKGLQLLGPFPSSVEKRAGYYRAQLWIQSPNRKTLHLFLEKLHQVLAKMKSQRNVRWSLDVDPLETL